MTAEEFVARHQGWCVDVASTVSGHGVTWTATARREGSKNARRTFTADTEDAAEAGLALSDLSRVLDETPREPHRRGWCTGCGDRPGVTALCSGAFCAECHPHDSTDAPPTIEACRRNHAAVVRAVEAANALGAATNLVGLPTARASALADRILAAVETGGGLVDGLHRATRAALRDGVVRVLEEAVGAEPSGPRGLPPDPLGGFRHEVA